MPIWYFAFRFLVQLDIHMDHQLYVITFYIPVIFGGESSDDDTFDRLNRKYTFYGLILLAIVTGSNLFSDNITSLISCWNRANFRPSYISYTNHVCFIASTYRLGSNETIINSIDDRLFEKTVFFS